MATTSTLKLVKEYCQAHCVHRAPLSVKDCDNAWCPLHEIRMGHRPNGNAVSEERRAELRESGKYLHMTKAKYKAQNKEG